MEKKYYLRGLGLGIIVTAIIMGITLSGGTKKREMTDDEVIARAKELGMIEDSRLLELSETSSDEISSDGENQDKEENPAEVKTPVKKDVAVKTEAEEKDTEKKDTAAVNSSNRTDKTEQKPMVGTSPPVETKPKTDTNEMTKQDDDESPVPSETKKDSDANPAPSETKKDGDANPALSETKKDGDANPAPSETAPDNETKPASGGTKSVTIVSGDSSYTVAKKLASMGVVSSASSYDTYLCEHGYDKKIRTGTFQIPADATDEQIARIVSGQ